MIEKQPSAHQMANSKDLVMPFGLTNAPVIFQALVNDVMMCDDDRSIFVCLLKWKFHSSSIFFLGYNLERGQVRTNPEMIQAVDWTTPTNMKQLQRFINFYCCFHLGLQPSNCSAHQAHLFNSHLLLDPRGRGGIHRTKKTVDLSPCACSR